MRRVRYYFLFFCLLCLLCVGLSEKTEEQNRVTNSMPFGERTAPDFSEKMEDLRKRSDNLARGEVDIRERMQRSAIFAEKIRKQQIASPKASVVDQNKGVKKPVVSRSNNWDQMKPVYHSAIESLNGNTFVTVRGLESSGTNFLRALLSLNFPTLPTLFSGKMGPMLDSEGIYGWKHG